MILRHSGWRLSAWSSHSVASQDRLLQQELASGLPERGLLKLRRMMQWIASRATTAQCYPREPFAVERMEFERFRRSLEKNVVRFLSTREGLAFIQSSTKGSLGMPAPRFGTIVPSLKQSLEDPPRIQPKVDHRMHLQLARRTPRSV